MEQIASDQKLREALSLAKRPGVPFVTNFYLDEAAMEPAARRGELFVRRFEDGALIVWRRRDFDRIYYAGSPGPALANAVAGVRAWAGRTVVSDVLGPPAFVEPLAGLLDRSGFRRYATFVRMQRIQRPDETLIAPGRSTEAAGRADLDELAAALAAHFDAYAEHLPEREEFESLLDAGQVRVVREDGAIASILIFDRAGLSTTLRYWLVLPRWRGRGAGDALMRDYFIRCAGARRFLLWVRQENVRARALYANYGYADAGVIDLIFRLD